MIILNSVSKYYQLHNESILQALDNVSIKLGNSGLVAITGESGSGKTTLINLIAGVDSYEYGYIEVLGRDYSSFVKSEFDIFRNFNISHIHQDVNLIEDYTVYDNIAILLEYRGTNKTKIDNKVNYAIEELDLRELSHRKIKNLSGGEKQRVAIARSIVSDSNIILADEPVVQLDSDSQEIIMKILRKISKTKLVVVVTHDEEIIRKFADRKMELCQGKIISDSIIRVIEEKAIIEKESEFNTNIMMVFRAVIRDILSTPTRSLFMIITNALLMCIIYLGFTFFVTSDFIDNQTGESQVVYLQKRDRESFTESDIIILNDIQMEQYSLICSFNYNFIYLNVIDNNLDNTSFSFKKILVQSSSILFKRDLIEGNLPLTRNEVVTNSLWYHIGDTINVVFNDQHIEEFIVTGLLDNDIVISDAPIIYFNDLFLGNNSNVINDQIFFSELMSNSFDVFVYIRNSNYNLSGILIDDLSGLKSVILYVPEESDIEVEDVMTIVKPIDGYEITLKVNNIVVTNDDELIGKIAISSDIANNLYNDLLSNSEITIRGIDRFEILKMKALVNDDTYRIIDPFLEKQNLQLFEKGIESILYKIIFITILMLMTYVLFYIHRNKATEKNKQFTVMRILGLTKKRLSLILHIENLLTFFMGVIILFLTSYLLISHHLISYSIYRFADFEQYMYLTLLLLFVNIWVIYFTYKFQNKGSLMNILRKKNHD